MTATTPTKAPHPRPDERVTIALDRYGDDWVGRVTGTHVPGGEFRAGRSALGVLGEPFNADAPGVALEELARRLDAREALRLTHAQKPAAKR